MNVLIFFVRMSDFVPMKHDNIPENQEVFIVHTNSLDAGVYPPNEYSVVCVESSETSAKVKAFDLYQAQNNISRHITSYSVDKYQGGALCSKCVQPRKNGPYDDKVILKELKDQQSKRSWFLRWFF